MFQFFILLVPLFLIYLILVRSLRYRRINTLLKQHGSTPTAFSNLNYRDAQTIIGQLVSSPHPSTSTPTKR